MSTAMLLWVETQPCWLLIGAKRIVPGSPFSGAVACGDRQEGNESGCLCPRHIRPQTQPGVPECTRPPGQLRLGIKSCWPWQVGQSPEALSTPAPSAVLIPGSPSSPPTSCQVLLKLMLDTASHGGGGGQCILFHYVLFTILFFVAY